MVAVSEVDIDIDIVIIEVDIDIDSKIQLVVYHQCCALIGCRLYVIAH